MSDTKKQSAGRREPKPDGNGNEPVPGRLVGLDIGYGFTKLVRDDEQRVMFPSVSNPLSQPYAAFSQPELMTIILENLVGKYLIGKAFNQISALDRERAEAAAREEVRQTIAQYCAGQPNNGAGIKICSDQSQ